MERSVLLPNTAEASSINSKWFSDAFQKAEVKPTFEPVNLTSSVNLVPPTTSNLNWGSALFIPTLPADEMRSLLAVPFVLNDKALV